MDPTHPFGWRSLSAGVLASLLTLPVPLVAFAALGVAQTYGEDPTHAPLAGLTLVIALIAHLTVVPILRVDHLARRLGNDRALRAFAYRRLAWTGLWLGGPLALVTALLAALLGDGLLLAALPAALLLPPLLSSFTARATLRWRGARELLASWPRPRGTLRCAFCHDEDLDAGARRCAGCGTRLHAECWDAIGRCPTLGCAHAGPLGAFAASR